MGTYSFDKQVGWNRMRGTVGDATGPAQKAIVQAGMNALGIEKERGITINTIIMGSIGFEALSKQKADKVGIEGYNRFLAEFHVARDEWEPIARAELARMVEIHSIIEEGELPDRWAVDDDGTEIQLSPTGRAWQCAYCAFNTTCTNDGPGVIRVLESIATIKENN
jgi:NAD(P)-dependent dehydrogenase (short-subunit alcohol dehydrogenase family)